MKPTNALRAILLRRAFLLVVVLSVPVLTACTLGENVMPSPPAGVAADRSAGLVAPVPAPIPHTLDGREECFTCHAIGAIDAPPVPAGHEADVTLCTSCHAVWLAPAIASAAAPAIPHEVAGREDCLVCHKLGTADSPRVPDNHEGLTSAICQTCHTSVGEITGEGEGEQTSAAEIPPIPHGLAGFSACTQCHEEGEGGIPRFPDDHKGRADDLCSACHKPQEEKEEEEEDVATPVPASAATPTETSSTPTGHIANGRAIYAASCALCHGAEGEGTAIAPAALNDATLLDALTDEDLATTILMGISGKMPASSNLSDQDVLDLIALLRSWD